MAPEGGQRSFAQAEVSGEVAPEAVRRCIDDKTEGSTEARPADSTGLAALTGEHVAALAMHEGGQRIQIAFCGGARLLELTRLVGTGPYLAAFYRHDQSCQRMQQGA